MQSSQNSEKTIVQLVAQVGEAEKPRVVWKTLVPAKVKQQGAAEQPRVAPQGVAGAVEGG